MAPPGEMAHADEALKALVARFREAPSSPMFTELAAALLSRGHAAEALRIAEHGLQIQPTSVDGRVERAAALLALGRPRVAYVELKRALAISPTHRRAMRLLGKAFVDAGAPGRAAEFLAQRSRIEQSEEQEATRIARTPFADDFAMAHGEPHLERLRQETSEIGGAQSVERTEETLAPLPSPSSRDATPAFPDLFSDLTRDLGLSDHGSERPSRVEVTQVIRRKLGSPLRSPSELEAIEGPIVDTTQPGQIAEVSGDIGVAQFKAATGVVTEPAPLFDAVTSPRMQLSSSMNLGDEPLFQEHMSFAVRPVEGPGDAGGEPNADLRETVDEENPVEIAAAFINALDDDTANMEFATPLESQGTQVDEIELAVNLRRETSGEFAAAVPQPLERRDTDERRQESSRDQEARGIERTERTEIERAWERGHGDAARPEAERPEPNRSERERPDRERETVSSTSSPNEMGLHQPPLLEIARAVRRSPQQPKLELIEPKPSLAELGLAMLGLLLMALYAAALAINIPEPWKPTFLAPSTVSSPSRPAPDAQRGVLQDEDRDEANARAL